MNPARPVPGSRPEMDTFADFPSAQDEGAAEFRCQLDVNEAGNVHWSLLHRQSGAAIEDGVENAFNAAVERLKEAAERHSRHARVPTIRVG